MLRRAILLGRIAPCTLFLLLSTVWSCPHAPAQEEDPYRALRHRMVSEEIAKEGVKNEAVLQALRDVPRHKFVGPDVQQLAYYDLALPIGHKQTISPPYVVAYMTAMLDPKPEDRVLEIGTGSGYQAAILSRIVKEVYTIEIVEPLGKAAAQRLQDLGYKNVWTKVGDGYKGWPEHAPFDKIIVTCSPEDVPQPLIEQLREGGKMIVPLGERFQQLLYIFEKRDGKLVKTKLVPTFFVPMTGAAEEGRKIRPDLIHPRIINGGFEKQTEGALEGWYYQRQVSVARDKAPEGASYVTFTNREPGRSAGMLQGFGIDGSKVSSLTLSLSVKADQTRAGVQDHEQPALVIQFYDANAYPVGIATLGPWLGTFDWKQVRGEIKVPPQAQLAVFRIGLNGAVGSLSVDNVRLETATR